MAHRIGADVAEIPPREDGVGGRVGPLTPDERSPLARSEMIVVGALAAIGLAAHLWFALGAGALDTDRSIVLLMARHFARGEPSIFFWRQNYMGALDPLLLTPLAWIGLANPFPAALVGIANAIVNVLIG